jgi:hypothetical protein
MILMIRLIAVIYDIFEGADHPPAALRLDPFRNGFCIIGKKSVLNVTEN